MQSPWVQRTLAIIYPPRCLGCGGLVENTMGLCGDCWRDTSFIAGLTCGKCGTPLPGESDTGETCDDCLRISRPWDAGRSVFQYRGTGRKLVLALKHGDRHDIVGPAAIWMARAARELLENDTLIVPVPLHPWRLLKRRYNQSGLLANALAKRTGHQFCGDALMRVRHTESLDGKNRDARFATLTNAITANPKRAAMIEGRNILIVDDVMTSGATLTAATEACFTAKAAEVRVVALARVGKDT